MIGLQQTALPRKAASQLRTWTKELTDELDFDARVKLAKRRFKSRNKKGSVTFDRIKTALYAMCNHTDRCVYCEDNFADEVEHMRPKDIYPEQCFAWENYVYACGPCNRSKNNHFAVIANGQIQVVTPPRPAPQPRTPPVSGSPLFIDPRAEDPMESLMLDLDSGGFAPHPNATDPRRGTWMRDTIGLNKRRLPKARLLARKRFRSLLRDYADTRDSGASEPELDGLKNEILDLNHQTVLREMARQREYYPELQTLFERVPEILTWW